MPTMKIIRGKPSETPRICGQERRSPKVAPELVRSALLGPGVNEETATSPKSAMKAGEAFQRALFG